MLRAMRFLWAALVVIACGSPSQVGDGLPQTCDPLRVPGACMMPWPNAIYLKADSTTETGFRVSLPPETLPARTNGDAFDPTRWNMADGFSPAGPMLYWFAEPIDATSLVPETNISKSLDVGAATVIVDMATNERVAHFSGVDENVHRDGDRQAIIITPAQRLLPKHRYAVAITKFIQTTSGDLPTPPPLFDRIVDGDPPEGDALAAAEAARMPDILASLKVAGVKRDDLVVAWDFVTGSDEALTGHVLSMRDQALQAAGPTGIGYTITSVEDDFDLPTYRRIRGTFTAPAFLDNEDESKPEAVLSFDGSGKPIMSGTYEAPFTILIPRVALVRPLPILLVGHGLFNTGEIELGDASGSDIQDLANSEGYIVVATDWIGLSAHENPLSQGSNNALAEMLSDFSHLPWVTDRLQQALVTTMVLVRTMTGRIATDPALAAFVDPSKVFYYGNSLGGIMGLSFMGYDPDVTLGALGVGGGFWSTLFQRSVNWKEALLVFPAQYPDSLDQQLLMALAQMQFDYSDPATVAPYVLNAPLAGTPKKQVVMMMGVGDAQVPNIATEMIARTSGIALLSPNAVDVFGMSPVSGPLPSALTTWNVNSPPTPPDTNMTPAHDNQVHQAIRRLPQEQQLVAVFFESGQVVDTCGGPCNLPVPAGTPPPDI
jgi:hypothetical protein